MTVFGTLKLPNLISRKIWMAEKFFAFHTVTSAERGSLGMLLPLWFYVKSILRDPKTAILALFEALNIDSFENSTFESIKISEFWAAKQVKMAVYETQKSPNLISRKIWVAF